MNHNDTSPDESDSTHSQEQVSQAILDALPACVAVVDYQGKILTVNQTWLRFAQENQGNPEGYVGENYLEIAQREGESATEAWAAYHGLRAVLDGQLPRFALEYPCHSPTQQRWFRMEATRIESRDSPLGVVMHHDITDRALAERNQQRTERRLQLALEAGGMGMWDWDIQQNVALWNTQAFKLFGLPPVDAPVNPQLFFDQVHPDDLAGFKESLTNSLKHKTDFQHSFRIVRPDGEARWLMGKGRVIFDLETNTPIQMIGINYDITEGKSLENQNRLHQLQLQSITRELQHRLRQQQAVAELGVFAFLTDQFEALLHRALEMLSIHLGCDCCKVLELMPDGQTLLLRAGVGWEEGVVGKTLIPSKIGSQAGYTLAQPEPVVVTDLRQESRFVGSEFLLRYKIVSGMSTVISGKDRPFGVLGVHSRTQRDYTAEDMVVLQSVANILSTFIEKQRIEDTYKLLVHSVKDYALFMLNTEGIVTSWNPGVEQIIGYTADEVIGRSVSLFFPEADQETEESIKNDLERAACAGRLELEGWRCRKDGTQILVKCVTFPMRDGRGRLLGFTRMVRDVTHSRLEEMSLYSILDHSVDAVFTINEFGTILSCGGAIRNIFDYEPEELVGQEITILMCEPYRSQHHQYLSRYVETGDAHIIGQLREVSGTRKDGSSVPLELVVTKFELDGRRFFTGILRNLTEKKKLEEQLRQSQKMDAIGQLAGGIAHDFNNLLTVITGYSQILQEMLPAGENLRGYVDAIRDAGNRAAAMTGQLLAFSRKQILSPQFLDLNIVLQDHERMLPRLIGENIGLLMIYALDPVKVKMDPTQLDQVILNLAINARDAMPGGGTMTITIRQVQLTNSHTQFYPGCNAGDYAQLTVSDTGIGMSEEIKRKAFEPFFTTKGQGKGTGLGLATVYGIVKQAKGFLHIDSTVGVGTSFHVFLPLVSEEASVRPISHVGLSLARGQETIFVVEDEPTVRNLTSLVLREQGYVVHEACNGQDALQQITNFSAPIHLLITDVIMPGMSGRVLVNTLLEQQCHPKMKVLFISGYTGDVIDRSEDLSGQFSLLRKPFTLVELTKKMRDLLDS